MPNPEMVGVLAIMKTDVEDFVDLVLGKPFFFFQLASCLNSSAEHQLGNLRGRRDKISDAFGELMIGHLLIEGIKCIAILGLEIGSRRQKSETSREILQFLQFVRSQGKILLPTIIKGRKKRQLVSEAPHWQ